MGKKVIVNKSFKKGQAYGDSALHDLPRAFDYSHYFEGGEPIENEEIEAGDRCKKSFKIKTIIED